MTARRLLSDAVADLLQRPADCTRHMLAAGFSPKLMPKLVEGNMATHSAAMFSEAESQKLLAPLLESVCHDYPKQASKLLALAIEQYPEDGSLKVLHARLVPEARPMNDSAYTQSDVGNMATIDTAPSLRSTGALVIRSTNRTRPPGRLTKAVIAMAMLTAVGIAVTFHDYSDHGITWMALKSRECESGAPGDPACWEVTKTLSKEPAVKGRRDNKKIQTYLDKACSDGSGERDACGFLSEVLARGDFGFSSDWTRAARIARQMCAQSQPANKRACFVYADALNRHRTSERREPSFVLSLLSGACSEEAPRACVDAAMMYLRRAPDLKPEEDPCTNIGQKECHVKARELLLAACKWNHAASCTQLASLLASDEAAQTSVKEFYKQACALNDGGACLQLAYLSTEDKVTLYKKACALGEGLACYNAAVAFALDDSGALALYIEGCNHDNGESCGQVGFFTEKGRGTSLPADPEKAHDYYAKGCRLGHAKSCFNLAACYYDGRGVQVNRNLARDFMERACELKNDRACKQLHLAF